LQPLPIFFCAFWNAPKSKRRHGLLVRPVASPATTGRGTLKRPCSLASLTVGPKSERKAPFLGISLLTNMLWNNGVQLVPDTPLT
jgi:hypothetical protein